MIINYRLVEDVFTVLTDDEPNLREINHSRLPTNVSWLYSQKELGLIAEQDVINLIGIMDTLQNMFPDMWDIQVSKLYQKVDIDFKNMGYGQTSFTKRDSVFIYKFNIIIRFPEITITNTPNKTHKIVELYVKTMYEPTNFNIERSEDNYTLKFGNPQYRIRHLSGLRQKLTETEYRCGYMHSHLPGKTSYTLSWGKFCLGHGEINNTFTMLYDNHSTDLFNMLCFQIDAYVRWESIEGVPHFKMENIISRQYKPLKAPPKIEHYTCNSFLNNLKEQIRMGVLSLPNFNWTLEGGYYKIMEDSAFYSIIKYSDNIDHYAVEHVLYKQGDLYYTPSILQDLTRTDPRNLTTNTFTFQGEDKRLEVDAPEQELPTDFIIHPEIVNYIKAKFENHINHGKIRNDILQRAGESFNTRISTQ